MSPYQTVEGIKMKVEGKDASRPHAVILIATLLSQTQEEKETQQREVFALLEEAAARETKDPFLTTERPKEVSLAAGLELSGVFSTEGHPVAAMINNEIYRTGDVVQGKRIVTIDSNRVVLEQGNRRFILIPTQQKEGSP
jgi:hypothetical protein